MRNSICQQCGKVFYENDGNPAVHYSTPELVCFHCKVKNQKKPGEYYQNDKGEWVQK